MKTTIKVQNPPEVVIGNGPMAIRRPYYSGGKVIVKVSIPCTYCKEAVVVLRSGLYQGSDHHESCYKNSGDSESHYEALKKSILNGMGEAEYQAKHGRAWNE